MIMQPLQLPTVALPALPGEGWHVVRAADRGLHWHPQVRDLLVHWLKLCSADGHLPARTALDRTLLGELLPYTWLMDVQRAPWRFRYRMAGVAFADALGLDVTGQWYDEIRPMAWSANRLRLITTVRDGVPTWRRGRVPMEDMAFETGGWSEIENLMLPLAFDGINTDTILGISMPYRPIELWAETETAAN